MIAGCAAPRSNAILGINYSDQPARVAMRVECNGQSIVDQGVAVCEQKGATAAKVAVKIPPLEGRVIYSNGSLKKTEDFNWYPKDGFWLWKKKPIKDTWAELELGEIAATYGDWPVALDVAAVHDKVGVIVTRGVLYHRVCDDQAIPCSRLVVRFECSGSARETAAGKLGKCERMSGSAQAFRIQLKGPGYEARAGAKVYLSVPRLGILGQSVATSVKDLETGELRLEIPQVLSGPSLVGIRLAWIEAGQVVTAETRILIMGFAPEWTGLDQPHFREGGEGLEFVKPVLSDLLEANLYEGRELRKKAFTAGKLTSFPRPVGSQVACAFAWARDSSDQTHLCLNANLQEVAIP